MGDSITVYINCSNENDKRYIIKLLFDFLRVPVIIQYHDTNEVSIKYGEYVFSMPDYLSGDFIDSKKIPDKPVWLETPFFSPIPFIYGTNKFVQKDKGIVCGVDIFASSFFMLTRWEELYLPKDRFGRCEEANMFVIRNCIFDRAIVNEYISLLSKTLELMHFPVKAFKRYYPLITHDIDALFRYADFKNFLKCILGDMIHRKSMYYFSQSLNGYLKFKLGKIKDPFDTFDFLMDLGDEYGYKDNFYFKASVKGERDCAYDIADERVRSIIANIESRKHFIGFHPSLASFHNPDQFRAELNRLRSTCSTCILGGRQHYLLYDLPSTLEVWEENHVGYDAGIGFYSHYGFRSGICYPYHYYDVIKKKQLDLIVHPLIVMEAARLSYDDGSLFFFNSVISEIHKIIDVVNSYYGEFVLLWHNDHFNRPETVSHTAIYLDTINYLYSKQNI